MQPGFFPEQAKACAPARHAVGRTSVVAHCEKPPGFTNPLMPLATWPAGISTRFDPLPGRWPPNATKLVASPAGLSGASGFRVEATTAYELLRQPGRCCRRRSAGRPPCTHVVRCGSSNIGPAGSPSACCGEMGRNELEPRPARQPNCRISACPSSPNPCQRDDAGAGQAPCATTIASRRANDTCAMGTGNQEDLSDGPIRGAKLSGIGWPPPQRALRARWGPRPALQARLIPNGGADFT